MQSADGYANAASRLDPSCSQIFGAPENNSECIHKDISPFVNFSPGKN